MSARADDWIVEQEFDGRFDIFEGDRVRFHDADDLEEAEGLLTNWRVRDYLLIMVDGYRYRRRVGDPPPRS